MTQMTQRNMPYVLLDREAVWWQGLMFLTWNSRTVTTRRIGTTLFVVTAECAPDASETIAAKLERLVLRHTVGTKMFVA